MPSSITAKLNSEQLFSGGLFDDDDSSEFGGSTNNATTSKLDNNKDMEDISNMKSESLSLFADSDSIVTSSSLVPSTSLSVLPSSSPHKSSRRRSLFGDEDEDIFSDILVAATSKKSNGENTRKTSIFGEEEDKCENRKATGDNPMTTVSSGLVSSVLENYEPEPKLEPKLEPESEPVQVKKSVSDNLANRMKGLDLGKLVQKEPPRNILTKETQSTGNDMESNEEKDQIGGESILDPIFDPISEELLSRATVPKSKSRRRPPAKKAFVASKEEEIYEPALETEPYLKQERKPELEAINLTEPGLKSEDQLESKHQSESKPVKETESELEPRLDFKPEPGQESELKPSEWTEIKLESVKEKKSTHRTSLFDDESGHTGFDLKPSLDIQPSIPERKEKKPVKKIEGRRASLFDDGDDGDDLLGAIGKPKKVTSRRKSLFDDD